MYRLLAALVAALVSSGLVAGAPAHVAGAPAQARTETSTTAGAVFSNPHGTRSQQTAILDTLADAAGAAVAGSVIRFAVYSFYSPDVAEALIDAHHRGVDVRIVVDDHASPRPLRNLREELGTDTSSRSYVTTCEGSCRGGNRHVLHTKFYLFSRTGADQRVAYVGSANVSGAGRRWDDLMVVKDNRRLWSGLVQLHDELVADRAFDEPHRRVFAGGYRLLVFSRTGSTRATDNVWQILDNIRCKGAETHQKRTFVRISMHAWRQRRGIWLAEELADLASEGCNVQVLTNGVSRAVRTILGDSRVSVRTSRVDGKFAHNKMVLIRGHYRRDRAHWITLTGSANFGTGSLRWADEVVLRAEGRDMWTTYNRQWLRMWRTR